MGAKHNLPSLENTVMNSADQENFYGGGVGGVGVVVVVKIFLLSSLRA